MRLRISKKILIANKESIICGWYLIKKKLELDRKKFENVIKTTSFNYMQNLEKEKGFSESSIAKTGNKIPFFNLGPKNDWRNKLDTEVVEKLEKAFKSEMEELGYI